MSLRQLAIQTRLGKLQLSANSLGLVSIKWADESNLMTSGESGQTAIKWLASAARQLTEYLEGKRFEFDVPVDPQGTLFQLQVWRGLQKIPYGETVSYQDIAIQIGNLRAVRAVGMANHRNPLPLIIPCHRIIRANGHLGGYAGGLERKRALLQLEKDALLSSRESKQLAEMRLQGL